MDRSNFWRLIGFPLSLAYFIVCLFLGGYPFNLIFIDALFNIRFSVILLAICILVSYGGMQKLQKNVVLEIFAIAVILGVAAYLRLKEISETVFMGPTVDEPLVVVPVLKMLRTGSLDFQTYEYGGVWFYVLLAVFIIFAMREVATFHYKQVSEITDQAFYVAGRYATAFFSLITVGATYWIARRSFGKLAAILSSSIVALSYLCFSEAHQIRLDHLLTLFVIIAHCFLLNILEERSGLNYVLAGMFIGLAIATKYTVLPLFVSLILAHAFAKGRTRWLDWNLIGALSAAVFTYVLFNAAALLHVNDLVFRLTRAVYHNLSPEHWSHEANRPLQNFKLLVLQGVGLFAIVPILFTLVQLVYRPDGRSLILWCFPILHLAMLGSYPSGFPRYLMPVIPNLAILAGEGTRRLVEWISLRVRSTGIRQEVIAAMTIFLMISFSSFYAFRHFALMKQRLKPQTVIAWIERNIPEGTTIFADPTGPILSRKKYDLHYISNHELRNLRSSSDVQYLCVTEDLFRYIPNRFKILKEFPAQTKDKDRYIRIYKDSLN